MLLEVANDSLKCLEFLHDSRGNPRTIVARVVAKNEKTGSLEVYYIARGEAPKTQGIFRIASYRAPIGSLASWAVGDEGEIYTPREIRDFSLQCKAQINAEFSLASNGARSWDSRNTKVSRINHDDVTILSLRTFVDQIDNLENSDQVVEGVLRKAITEVALRDQPILDRSQDEIFRSPISARIFLSGRPGSGKTTTLIRRLGQKTDIQALGESNENVNLLEETASDCDGVAIKKNWYFFSPTRSMGSYLASAISREGLVGNAENIKVWDDFSQEIAQSLRIIRSANTVGDFIFDGGASNLNGFAKDNYIFDSFWEYYISAIRTHLKNLANGWTGSQNTEVARTGRNFIEYIENNNSIGKLLSERRVVIKAIGQLDARLLPASASTLSYWIKYVSRMYRSFRREPGARKWFRDGVNLDGNSISKRELDILLLAYLRASTDMLEHFPASGILQDIKKMRRIQVLVDEATDFSIVQLACMYELSHPNIRSFFLSGDLNQRFSSGGIRNMGELKWINRDFKIMEVSKSYRQSIALSKLADVILTIPDGAIQRAELPTDILRKDSVLPVWAENLNSTELATKWLRDRINEIVVRTDRKVTIAVFVNSENKVTPMAEALTKHSEILNRGVVACHNGEILGINSDDIRVFDVKHIRGLEFEAAFFIGVDELIDSEPNSFLSFLYVGATRAATFLGMTFSGSVPVQLRALEGYFESSWGQHISNP